MLNHSISLVGHRVFITGGCGFIGKRLVSQLLPMAVVAVFDDISAGIPELGTREGLSLYHGDIRNVEQVVHALQEFRSDTLIGLAALHHELICEDDPRRTMNINVVGLQSVLDEYTRVACKPVLLASGDTVDAFPDQPLHEDMRLYTNDVYAASKLRNGHQLRLSVARTGYSAITAHLLNAIGWGGDSNGHLVPESLKHQNLYSAGTIDRPIKWRYCQKTYQEVGWQASIPISHSIDDIAQMWHEGLEANV